MNAEQETLGIDSRAQGLTFSIIRVSLLPLTFFLFRDGRRSSLLGSRPFLRR
jgi:hypothetical protein